MQGTSPFDQMKCEYISQLGGARCYDLSMKCTTGFCDVLSCFDGYTCQSLGPVSKCRPEQR